ncbi:hypothetical protein F1K75_15370 [Vibrio cholerae]|nr:hypothetical protein [Vibrio cholerae]EGR2119503.1 hypothetical protein [Vibrio cholerae]
MAVLPCLRLPIVLGSVIILRLGDNYITAHNKLLKSKQLYDTKGTAIKVSQKSLSLQLFNDENVNSKRHKVKYECG